MGFSWGLWVISLTLLKLTWLMVALFMPSIKHVLSGSATRGMGIVRE
jgi:hypothetical protein